MRDFRADQGNGAAFVIFADAFACACPAGPTADDEVVALDHFQISDDKIQRLAREKCGAGPSIVNRPKGSNCCPCSRARPARFEGALTLESLGHFAPDGSQHPYIIEHARVLAVAASRRQPILLLHYEYRF